MNVKSGRFLSVGNKKTSLVDQDELMGGLKGAQLVQGFRCVGYGCLKMFQWHWLMRGRLLSNLRVERFQGVVRA